MGVDSFGPRGRVHVQATLSSSTLVLLIFFSGLNPVASYVRRHASHSPSSTLVSMASVTGRIVSSGLRRAGGGGMVALGANAPPPTRGKLGAPIAFNASASTESSRVPGLVPFSWSMYATSAAYVESPTGPGR